MKKILLLATVLCIAFALCLTTSAAIPEGWSSPTGNDPANVYVTEDKGLALNTNCHSGIMLDTELGESYTLQFQVRTSDIAGVGVPYVILGTSSDSWVNNASVVLAFRNWADGYPHFIFFKGIGDMAALGYYGNGKMFTEGYNDVTVVVDYEDGKQYLTYMINNELIAAGIEMPTSETTGKYIGIACYADRPATAEEVESATIGWIKNFKVTVNGTTTTYFAASTDSGVESTPPASVPTGDASLPTTTPDIEIIETNEFDWTIVAIIGGVVVLAAAAFVVYIFVIKKK